MKMARGFKLPKAEYLQQWFNKYKYLILVCLVGLALLLWPKSTDAKDLNRPVSNTESVDQVAALERQMEDLFSSISGVGQVKVLLTVKSSTETVYAYDTDQSTSKRENEQSQSIKTELITVGSGSGEAPSTFTYEKRKK